MLMPERSVGSANYRYAFNGMELDNEVSGNGNSYTTEFRQYDPRLGRWKSLDPLMHQFPWMSPYVAFDNNPVYYTDPFGLSSESGGGDKPSRKERKAAAKEYADVFLGKEADGKIRIRLNKNGSFTASFKINGKRVSITVTDMKAQAPQNQTRIILVKHTVSNWQSFKDWLNGVEKSMKGNASWTYGIEFKTNDGKWNGNTANPVHLKDADKVITLDWDDIKDFQAAIDQLKRKFPDGTYKPKEFQQEASKWIEKQHKNKNWSERKNRADKPALKKADSTDVNMWKGGAIKNPGSYTYRQSNSSINAGERPNEDNSRIINSPQK